MYACTYGVTNIDPTARQMNHHRLAYQDDHGRKRFLQDRQALAAGRVGLMVGLMAGGAGVGGSGGGRE